MGSNVVKNLTEGLHVYINIDNFDSLLVKEERNQHNIKHSLKLLNSFFVAIRRYTSQRIKFPGLHIEKVTGNRMHLYIEMNKEANYSKDKYAEELILLSIYAKKTIDCLNNDISKLNSLDDASISIGADYGEFRAFEFFDTRNNIDEETSIGFAANYACKLQIVVNSKNKLAVSKEVFSLFSKETCGYFIKEYSNSLVKYSQTEKGYFYSSSLNSLLKLSNELSTRLVFNSDDIRDITNHINFSEMTFSRVRNKLNVNSLTEKDSKVFTGIALFSDIRNFTSQFKDDDTNLKEKSDQAIKAISSMINEVVGFEGSHIQIQGDKEVAVFPLEYEPENGESIRDAVNCALTIIDQLRKIKLEAGIGMSYGDIYASVIDVRGSKSNVILGKSVTLGNKLEDDCAAANELVISQDLYDTLSKYKESKYLCGYFRKRDYYYVTSKSFDDIRLNEEKKKLDEETRNKSYYGVHFVDYKA